MEPRSYLKIFDTDIQITADITFPISFYLTPPQIATAYNIPANNGAGIKVGIISLGGGFLQHDLDLSMTAMGLPTNTVNQVLLDGATGVFSTTSNTATSMENALDLYCVAGMVPSANITLYITTSSATTANWNDIFQRAIDDGCDVISHSWGTAEYYDFCASAFANAAAANIPILIASGDYGSDPFSSPIYGEAVQYPTSNPNVISVGGTLLKLNPDNTRFIETLDNSVNDPVFNSNTGWGGGGGISTLFSVPIWQSGLTYTPYNTSAGAGSPTSLTNRGIPDISAPMNAYSMYFNGRVVLVGGTSAAAPIMAGMLARLKALTGKALSSETYNKLFYSNSGTFYDIISGNNATEIADGYSATVGWDAASGLGAPNGTSIYNAIIDASLSNLTITTSAIVDLSFNSSVLDYSTAVANGVSAITINPTASQLLASITINGSAVGSGSAFFASVNVGSNIFTIVVTALSGATQTYTLTVNRASTVSSDATLGNLTLSSGILSPTFSSGVLLYTTTVSPDTGSITVTPTVDNINATVTVNKTSVTSGTPSNPITLNPGSNTITIVVTAQNGANQETYVVQIFRSLITGTDFTTSSFSLSGGNLGTYRSNDNYYIPITAQDSVPLLGPVTYALTELLDGGNAICTSATYSTNKLDLGTSTTGTTGITTTSFGSSVSSSTWLPSTLHLDPATGYIYGYVPPQSEYLKKYTVSISATKTFTTSTASITVINTFTLGMLNNDPDILTWVSSSTQSIIGGLISELKTIADHTKIESPLEYSFVGTATPYFGGFTITNAGNIVGQGTTGTYTATVVAWNPYYPVELFNGGESYQTQDYDVYGGYANSFNGLAYTNTLTSFILDGGHVDTFGVAIDGGSALTPRVYDYNPADGGNARSTYGSTDFYLNGGNARSTYEILLFTGGGAGQIYIKPLHDTDGGSADSVYTINDWSVDGGSVQTLFGTTDIFLDGGISASKYNNLDLSGGYAASVFGPDDLIADCGHAQLIPVFDPSLAGASYIYPFSTQTLTINVTDPLIDVPYTAIYVRPFLSIPKRQSYSAFMNDRTIFPSNILYRVDDPNFGIQKDIRMTLEFGIQELNLDYYVPALWENFNRRRLSFGNVKVARAKDQLGNYLYDVVYADIIDDIDGVKPVIYDKNLILYPASVDNMKKRLESIVLPNYTYISVDQYHLPKFMQTAQPGTYLPTNYIKVVPLCYTLPGKSNGIVDQIKLSKFDFKLFDFEIDRLIIQNSLDNATAKYMLFPRRNLTSTLPQDNFIFVDPTTSTSYVTDDSGNILLRD